MRVITHCPACQTQFFATEEQLNQHDGKVRCGQCRHVFNAREQILNVAQNDKSEPDKPSSKNTIAAESISNAIPTKSGKAKKSKSKPLAETAPAQPAYMDGISGKSKLNRKLPGNRIRPWLWGTACLFAILTIIAQSLFFMRNEIALYYPQFKPLLVRSCQVLNCKIQLPEEIELIVIDDSDMQEDPERAGLIYLSSTLINTGDHTVAYPDLELTLTDVDDNPVIRRIFKPAEYLPKNISQETGLNPHAEIRVKLAISVDENKVSGYRVFVTY